MPGRRRPPQRHDAWYRPSQGSITIDLTDGTYPPAVVLALAAVASEWPGTYRVQVQTAGRVILLPIKCTPHPSLIDAWARVLRTHRTA